MRMLDESVMAGFGADDASFTLRKEGKQSVDISQDAALQTMYSVQ